MTQKNHKNMEKIVKKALKFTSLSRNQKAELRM